MGKFDITLPNSADRNVSIALLDTNERRAAEYEALWDLDPDLSRTLLFSFHNIADARRAIKQNHIQIAIAVDQFSGLSLSSIIVEISSANPDIEVAGVVAAPSMQLLRECHISGPLFDLLIPDEIGTFLQFKQLSQNLLRRFRQHLDEKFRHSTSICDAIHHSVLATRQDLIPIKDASSRVLALSLPKFDFSRQTALTTIQAERIYFDHIDVDRYTALLKEGCANVLQIIQQVGTSTKEPSSASGLLVHAVNAIAFGVCSGMSLENLKTLLEENTPQLRHRAIRAFTDDLLEKTLRIPDRLHSAS